MQFLRADVQLSNCLFGFMNNSLVNNSFYSYSIIGLEIGRNINTSAIPGITSSAPRSKQHTYSHSSLPTNRSDHLTHHISIRIVPWWHLRREVPLCWRADKSGGAGWSSWVSAWGGVTEPAAQRTCAPRFTVRPRHGSKGVKICTGISQIRFCSAPLKSFTRQNYPLCPLFRRRSAQLCASDRFLWNQNSHFDPKIPNINFLRSGQALNVPERKARLCSFAGCLFWTDPVSSCLWCTLTLVDGSVRHGSARHRSSLRMRPVK